MPVSLPAVDALVAVAQRLGAITGSGVTRALEPLQDPQHHAAAARRRRRREHVVPDDPRLERLALADLVGGDVVGVLGDEVGDGRRAPVADRDERLLEILGDDAGRVAVDPSPALVAQEDRNEDLVQERPLLVPREALARELDRR